MKNTLCTTPEKSTRKNTSLQTSAFSTSYFSTQPRDKTSATIQISDQKINFKRKAYEMTSIIIDLKKKQKKHQILITELSRQISILKVKIQGLTHPPNKKQEKQSKKHEIYSAMDNFCLFKISRDLQISEQTLKKYKDVGKYSLTQNTAIFVRNIELQLENKQLKKQLRQAIIENSSLRSQTQKLEKIQVSSRSVQQTSCGLIKKKNEQYNSGESQFSFAGSPKWGKESESSNSLERLEMQVECCRASIGGLLEQNKQLKKLFLALHRSKSGQQLADCLQKQINIMKSILELNTQQYEHP